jgi:anti-anti-sigma factor
MTYTVTGGEGDVTVVSIAGELDTGSVDELYRGVADALTPPPARLVIDLARLRFADSSAIALWVRWASMVGAIELRNASPLLRRVVTTMGLSERLGLQ